MADRVALLRSRLLLIEWLGHGCQCFVLRFSHWFDNGGLCSTTAL